MNNLIKAMYSLFGENNTDALPQVWQKGYMDAFKDYDEIEVMKACREIYNNPVKYRVPRKDWPRVGDIQKVMNEWGIVPKVKNALPAPKGSFEQIKKDAGEWYHFNMLNGRYRSSSIVHEMNMHMKEWWESQEDLRNKFKHARFQDILALWYQRNLHREFIDYVEQSNLKPLVL